MSNLSRMINVATMLSIVLGIKSSGNCRKVKNGQIFSFEASVNIRYVLQVALRQMYVLMIMLIGVSLPIISAAPVTIDLKLFTSGAGARIHGSTVNAFTGSSVSVIGDHNGDGFQDYMFGSYGLMKAVIVMKRNTSYTPTVTNDIVSGEFFRVIQGVVNSDMGTSVGGIGDINGDGFDDVIVSAYNGLVSGRGDAGYAYVIFGMTGPFTDLTVTATWAASSLGFMILGTAEGGALGENPLTTRGLGDVNGDGIDDLVISDRFNAGSELKSQAGVVWVIFGKKAPAFTTIDLLPANFGSNGVTFTGDEVGAHLGFAVNSAGDFNGDGFADFLIGAPYTDPVVNGVTRTNSGVAYLIHGSNTTLASTVMSAFTTGPKGVRFLGAVAVNDNLGYSLAGVGDINGDGMDDIAIGAYNGDAPYRGNAGIVYAIYGTKVVFTADVDLNGFNSFSKGFAIYGRDRIMSLANVAPAGDINQDGVNDILVSAAGAVGDVVIVYGQSAARTEHVDTESAEVTTFTYADTNNELNGNSLDGGKDLNGDGIPDLLVGGRFLFIGPEGGGDEVISAGVVWMLPGPFILPTPTPTAPPSRRPTAPPTALPSLTPTWTQTGAPSTAPSIEPSLDPTIIPSAVPSLVPSVDPTVYPSLSPSALPSAEPSVNPTENPSMEPSVVPSLDPSMQPSAIPTVTPSATPSQEPSVHPSSEPSMLPSAAPTAIPSCRPSVGPTLRPTDAPSFIPTMLPSALPTIRPTNLADKDFSLVANVQQVQTHFIANAIDFCNLNNRIIFFYLGRVFSQQNQLRRAAGCLQHDYSIHRGRCYRRFGS